MKKGFLKSLAVGTCAMLALSSGVFLTGCGNMDLFDLHYELRYVVINENGDNVLHTIDKWTDSDSESFTVSTKCCNNYIWASANNAVLYKNKPDAKAYDRECNN